MSDVFLKATDELPKMSALQKSAYDFLYILGNQDPGYREIGIADNLLTRYPTLMTEVERVTSYLSTGGAFLEWMEGKTLPGVAALLE